MVQRLVIKNFDAAYRPILCTTLNAQLHLQHLTITVARISLTFIVRHHLSYN